MTLPSSGTITLGNVASVIKGTSTANISMGDAETRLLLGNTTGVVSLGSARGKPLAGIELFYPQGLTKTEALHQAIVYFGTMFSQGGIKALGFGMERFLPAATLNDVFGIDNHF